MEESQPDEKSEEKKQDDASEKTSDAKASENDADKHEKDDQKVEPEEETKEKEEDKAPPELSKEEIIRIYKTFPGVGQVIAERIYDAGFDNREKMKTISVLDLKNIAGVGQVMAEDIAKNIEPAIKKFDEPEVKEEPKKEGKGITDKAIGFVKGTISKITGFFKGKSPKPKTKPTEEPKISKPKEGKTETELKSGSDIKPGETESNKDEKSGETYFPEVGSPKEEVEEKPKHEPVSVESSDAEPTSKLLEPEKEEIEPAQAEEPTKEPEPEPKLTPKSETPPKINLTDSSGLLMWFESTPNLRPEAGRLLFKAGYNNLEELMEAVVEDLVLVNGINEMEAKTIHTELRKIQ